MRLSRNENIVRSPLIWGLTISLFIHMGLLLLKFRFRSVSPLQTQEPTAPIEVADYRDSRPKQTPAEKRPRTKEQQIVETEKLDNQKFDPNAKYLSDKTQTADKAMRAKIIDDFREKKGSGLTKEKRAVEQGTPPTGVDGKPDLEVESGVGLSRDSRKSGIKRDWKTLSLKDLGVFGDGGFTAASDDNLNAQEGERTLLSTREFRFFSYYHRIKELLRQYWKPGVERKMAKLYAGGKKIEESEVVTKLMVLLSPSGNIERVSRLTSSGFTDIDNAAVEAFQQAAPFPNPPKGIVDPDGFVRIRWDFILTVEAAPRIQFQATRGVGSAGPR